MKSRLKAIISSVALLSLGAVIFGPNLALKAQMWMDFPILGGPSFCASTVNAVCVSTIPAGPADWTGKESLPVDTNAGTNANTAPQTVKAFGVAFGAGALVVVTSPVTAAIPGGTPNYILSGAQGSAFTITMPATPVGGHVQRILCDAATVGVMTVAANTGQTLKNNPAAACVAGVGYSWVYNQTATTWYRLQ